MIRYKKLGYVALNVSDLARSKAFYGDILGLTPNADGSDSRRAFFRCSDQHHDVVLVEGPTPGLKYVSFELEDESQFANLTAVLDQNGLSWHEVARAEQAQLRIGPAIRTAEPATGCVLEFYVSMAPAPAAFQPEVVNIQRLGHVVLRAANYPETVRFFNETLNFQVSDQIDGLVTFTRCFPNPFHHSLGIGNGRGRNGLHHVNFMCTDMDDIGKSLWRLQKLNVPIVFGPGRHPPSGSIFLYFLDPDGLTMEYSFGMEQFPEQDARPPRTLPAIPESFDFWGAPMDPRNSATGEIEKAL